ncbi:unnamed protein product [Cylicostephanus goldi]|uniref:ornithine decarboxylase n=1 Tax=Cylicostephanus goldi TaxID=71465 RepID=A0A3P7MIC8_CYLGO|nr:unnamed protein product [Cylicostephanus goldi]
MTDNIYRHDGTLSAIEFARKVAEDYDARDICEPFAIIDLDVVKRQLDLWNIALPSVKPFYAVKCNPDLNILRALSANGACFDCASVTEIKQIFLDNLAKGNEIILAHPIKSRQCIEYAIENGVTMMTIDSVEELRKIAGVTKKAKLILRIKVTGFDALVDLNKKFGADDVTSKLIFHEAKKIGVKIYGISFHIGSGVVNCRPVALSLANARKLLDYGRMLGHPVDIIDIGGGFVPTSNTEFLKIGHFIENTLSTCFEGVAVSVIAEPGRFLVTNAQYVATRVSQVVLKSISEDIPESYSIYLNDGVYGSFNFVLTEKRKATGYPLFNEREGHMRADIWGPTCCSFDIIEVKFSHFSPIFFKTYSTQNPSYLQNLKSIFRLIVAFQHLEKVTGYCILTVEPILYVCLLTSTGFTLQMCSTSLQQRFGRYRTRFWDMGNDNSIITHAKKKLFLSLFSYKGSLMQCPKEDLCLLAHA